MIKLWTKFGIARANFLGMTWRRRSDWQSMTQLAHHFPSCALLSQSQASLLTRTHPPTKPKWVTTVCQRTYSMWTGAPERIKWNASHAIAIPFEWNFKCSNLSRVKVNLTMGAKCGSVASEKYHFISHCLNNECQVPSSSCNAKSTSQPCMYCALLWPLFFSTQ